MFPAMDEAAEIKASHLRNYKREWMARRRQQIKAESGEEVRLFLPKELAADLRDLKPNGFTMRRWLVAQLQLMAANRPDQPVASSRSAAISTAEQRPNRAV